MNLPKKNVSENAKLWRQKCIHCQSVMVSGEEGKNRQSPEDLGSSETIMYDTILKWYVCVIHLSRLTGRIEPK